MRARPRCASRKLAQIRKLHGKCWPAPTGLRVRVRADGRDQRSADVLEEEVPDVALLLDGPLVRLEEDRIRERDKVRGEDADEVRDAGDRGACRVVDVL